MPCLSVSCGVCSLQQNALKKPFSYSMTVKPPAAHHPPHYDCI
jgi:hypothetical protein